MANHTISGTMWATRSEPDAVSRVIVKACDVVISRIGVRIDEFKGDSVKQIQTGPRPYPQITETVLQQVGGMADKAISGVVQLKYRTLIDERVGVI